MSTYDEYRKALAIDKHDLDTELCRFPVLYDAVAHEYTVAVADRDAAKANLDNVTPTRAVEIRAQLINDGKKVTDKAVGELVQTDTAVIKAELEYLSAKKGADQWLALKDAHHQRGYMLRDLCSLYIAGYFAESSVKESSNVSETKYQSARRASAEQRLKGN